MELNVINELNQISFLSCDNKVLAYLKYDNNDGILHVTHTKVEEVLQGQGIAGKLMNELYAYAKKHNYKVVPICSYAIKWFEKNQEKQDILLQTN